MTTRDEWCPDIGTNARPLFRAIVEALRRDIASGRLGDGDRLPPQRVLAAHLGIDFTTVTRAYAEARRQGLVATHAGRGTYVRLPQDRSRPPSRTEQPVRKTFIDMTMNLPPQPRDAYLQDRLASGLAVVQSAPGALDLLQYPPGAGQTGDKSAAIRWFQNRLDPVDPECVLVSAGTQSALTALLTMLAGPGDQVCAEALTYPVFRALCAQLDIGTIGLDMDEFGLRPEAFRAACRTHAPKALYCCPTLHNPTTATMTEQRRRDIADIAVEFGVPVIEDDAYGRLPDPAPSTLAAYAPDNTYLISGLSKCLAPGLRIAYVHAPGPRQANRLASALRATALMPTPLTVALAAYWIETGSADAILQAIRRDAVIRQSIAAKILDPGSFGTDPQAFHGWLALPEHWSRSEFTSHMRSAGVALVASDAFATVPHPPHAVRLCLGAAPAPEDLERVLWTVRDALAGPPAVSAAVG